MNKPKSKRTNNGRSPSDDLRKKKKIELTALEKFLWGLTVKYKGLQKKNQVIPISESEEDRKKVSNAYPLLKRPREKILDGTIYKYLTKMQRTRDTRILLEKTTPEERLKLLAWEVRIRTSPLIFLHGHTYLHLNLFETFEKKERKDILDIIIDEEIHILDEEMEKVRLRPLTEYDIANMKQKLMDKLINKKIPISSLHQYISHWEADILSQLIRNEEITIVLVFGNLIEFRKGNREKKSGDTIPTCLAIPFEN